MYSGRLDYIKSIKLSEITFERIYNSFKVRLLDIPHRTSWELPNKFLMENKKKLLSYRDIHKEKRCFIIANGPSLKGMDLSLLQNEITFGMNRIYLLKKVNNFIPSYLVVIDIDIQLKQFANDLNELNLIRFFNWNTRKLFDKQENLIFIKETFRPRFSTDLINGIWGGHSVTYACLQIAYYMGIKKVILIGKDHSFKEQGIPGQYIINTGNESNHFLPGYYKKGMGWRIPDYKGEELAYKMAKDAFERDGRVIVDATVGGKLDVFKKVNFSSLF